MNLQITDDGKGLKIVATPENLAGKVIPLPAGENLAYNPSDPTAFALQPDPTDPSGLTQDVVPPAGGAFKDGTGYTVTLTATDAGGDPPIIDTTPQFDIVLDDKLGGFTFQLTAL